MIKKLLVGLLAIMMCFSLIACSSSKEIEDTNDDDFEEYTDYYDDEEYMTEDEISPGEDNYDEYGDD